MEENDERFAPTINSSLERPTVRGIYFTVIRPTLAEFYGVFFLTFGLYLSTAVIPAGYGDFIGPMVIVFLYIGIYSITRSISGGHLNPIITLVQMARRAILPLVGICYLGAHILGAVVGAFAVEGVTKKKQDPRIFEPPFETGHAIFAEMIGTTIVILAYLTLANRGKGNTAILGIGFGYAGALLAVHGASSGYLNPALNFGIAAASGVWTKHYVYWVGTALGGIKAALVYGLIFASDHHLWIRQPSNYMPERIA